MSLPVRPHGTDSPFDSIRRVRPDGSEFWSARDLMPLLGYEKWERFEDSITRAAASARNSGDDEGFSRRRENLPGSGRPREDFHLSRFAAYLVAMNGDPRKPEVAAAQAYFAIRTREAETTTTTPSFDLANIDDLSALTQAASRAVEIARTERAGRELAETKVAELTAAAEVDAPKVVYVNTFVTDADLLSIRTVAGTIGIQETALRQLLIDSRWIYRETASRWSATENRKVQVHRYSAYADHKRHFRAVEKHDVPRFRDEIMHTLKVTPAGAEAIARLVARKDSA